VGGIRVVAVTCALALGVPAAAFAAGFDAPQVYTSPAQDAQQQFAVDNPHRHDTPNDPGYDAAEPDDEQHAGATNLYDERFDLFGFASQLTRNTAKYKDAQHGHAVGDPQISGLNASGAWKISRGRPDVQVAILDTGINWDECALRTKVALNVGELPLPRDGAGHEHPNAPQGGYDLNGDGAVNVDDWKDDASVPHTLSSCGGLITGLDLIKRFSDGSDADGNGYKDDVAGWDYFNDDNDPSDTSSYFQAGNHGTGRTKEAVARTNDGEGDLGVCPRCQFVPLRVWDTFVADANNFGMAMAYAADNHIEVIEGADGGLYHSAFSEAASQYAYEHGAAQVYSGDDLNTGNHNYPANYDHTMLIEGVVADAEGLGTDPGSGAVFFQQFSSLCPTFCTGSNVPVQSYFRGGNTTQFGGHSSVSSVGSTGSQATGKAAGAVALVISAARDAGVALSADESRTIVEQTAEDVTAPNTVGAGAPDPAQPGWDEHFGWGRIDLGKAVVLAKSGKVPPEATIESPDWYAPLTGDKAKLTGRLRARFATGGAYDYRVEWAPGLAPADGDWQPVKTGHATGVTTDLGELDLAAIRSALATHVVLQDTGGPVFSPTGRNPFQDQFSVRVTVDGQDVPTPGVDRKVLTAVPDAQGLRPGFPKRLGTGGEAPLRYADLDGDNHAELVLPTEDGVIHAYRPDGSELPGWPVQTRTHYTAVAHGGAPVFASGGVATPREPPRGPTIADLDGDGRPEVITAAGLRIYAWHSDGTPLPNFPVESEPAFCDKTLQRKGKGGAWHRKCGFLATPAVGHLEGRDKPLDIVAPSLDGHVYALRADASRVPGFPVDLVDPAKAPADKRFAESINEPGIGDLNGDGRDDVVVPTNEAYGDPGDPGTDVSFAGFLGTAGGQSTRVYAVNGADGHLLPGWPISISGLIQNVLPLIGPGHAPALAKVGGQQRVITSATSGKLASYKPDGSSDVDMRQEAHGPMSNETDRSPGLNLFESAAVGDLLGAGQLDVVKYDIGLAQAANLLLVGQNVPYNHRIGAWDASTGSPLDAWPTITDDYQFLSSSSIAKVDGLPTPIQQVLAGTGLGLLHAYDGVTGQDVPGFPKVTGGWLFAPAALSDDGRMAAITREGYLFEWDSAAAKCQTEWPEFRHDPQGTGNYDADGTAPGAPEALDVRALGGGRYSVSFTSPGDDRMCGTPAAYVARVDGQAVDLGAPRAAGEKVTATVTLPGGARTLTVQARDEAGNLGAPATFALAGTPSGPGATPGAGSLTSGPAGLGLCRDRSAPRSSILRRGLRATRRRLSLSGTSTDRGCGARGAGAFGRVYVAVYRPVRGACRWLRADGRLTARRSCRRPVLLRAAGTARWRLAKSVHLPRGRYGVWALGVDAAGNREGGALRARRASFVVR
jgi:hypothetical protein